MFLSCQLILGTPIRTILTSLKSRISSHLSETIARLKQFNVKSLIHKQNILPAAILVVATVLVGYNVSNASGSSTSVTDHPNNLLFDYLEKDVVTEKASDSVKTASYQTVATLASAQTATVVTDAVAYEDESDAEMAVSLAGQVIEKPVAVTSDTVTRQRDKIIEHVVEPGETLGSIARSYNLKLSTVLWANNMNTATKVQPGWTIGILPVDGVRHKVEANDTVQGIAEKYKANKDVIVAFNNLKNEQLPEGATIVIPDGTGTTSLDPAPTPAPVQQVTRTARVRVASYSDDIPSVIRRGGGHSFPYGWCTYWAAKMRGGVNFGGNAKEWPRNARAAGYATGKTPVVGATYVEPWLSRYGHVSAIIRVNGDGSFVVSEMNYAGWGRVSTRTISSVGGGTVIY